MNYILSLVFPFVNTVFAAATEGDRPSGLENPLAGGANTISEFLAVILKNLVLPIGSVVIVFMLIYSGFMFVTARGNEEKLGTAKRNFLYVLIGAAILLGAAVISGAIEGTLCQLAPDLPTCVDSTPATPLN